MTNDTVATTDPRLSRVRRLARWLDRSIPIGGGRRIGIDPLLGLLPGGGDALGAMLSCYILFEAALLGLPVRTLGRMLGNIAIESIVGIVPLFGDLFDFAWQANVRNVRLIETAYRPDRPTRSGAGVICLIAAVCALLLALIVAATWWLVSALWSLLPI
ncbi:DUF4112 domain-containing protein [Synoicihabitans lomoniglobus]|uniref:DUF4112 domain-containing protein n=1 Tax=Synoicihabitans lomoniglobus TaxID=2909285 RepID=A0AAE9ZZP9_9BACT|nr:DUF4112 domain-containing protein [Opitutaceae bacterium LMO-M01]WED64423.1 DUF4112 domain-containing protein [Opitutaceae bacterium LMO-M01]